MIKKIVMLGLLVGQFSVGLHAEETPKRRQITEARRQVLKRRSRRAKTLRTAPHTPCVARTRAKSPAGKPALVSLATGVTRKQAPKSTRAAKPTALYRTIAPLASEAKEVLLRIGAKFVEQERTLTDEQYTELTDVFLRINELYKSISSEKKHIPVDTIKLRDELETLDITLQALDNFIFLVVNGRHRVDA